MKKLVAYALVWILAFGVVLQLGLWLTVLFAVASLLYWLAALLKNHQRYIRAALFGVAVLVVIASIWRGWLPSKKDFVECANSRSMRYFGALVVEPRKPPTDQGEAKRRFEREAAFLEERAAQLADAPSAIRGSDNVAAWLGARGSASDSSALFKAREAMRAYLKEQQLFELDDLKRQIQEFKALNEKFRQMFADSSNDPRHIKQQYDRAVVNLPFESGARLFDDLRRETSNLLSGVIRVHVTMGAKIDEKQNAAIYEERISLSSNELPLVKVNLSGLIRLADASFEHRIALVDPADRKELEANDPREVSFGQAKTNVVIVHRIIQREALHPACAELALPVVSLRPTRRVEMRWPNPFQADFVVWVRLSGIANEPEIAVQATAKREEDLNSVEMPPHSVMLSNWKIVENDAGDKLEPAPEQKSILWFRQGNQLWAELAPDWWFCRNAKFREVRSYIFTENLLTAGLIVLLGAMLAAFVKKAE